MSGTALLPANAGEPGGASVTLLWSLSLLLTHTSEETSLTQRGEAHGLKVSRSPLLVTAALLFSLGVRVAHPKPPAALH